MGGTPPRRSGEDGSRRLRSPEEVAQIHASSHRSRTLPWMGSALAGAGAVGIPRSGRFQQVPEYSAEPRSTDVVRRWIPPEGVRAARGRAGWRRPDLEAERLRFSIDSNRKKESPSTGVERWSSARPIQRQTPWESVGPSIVGNRSGYRAAVAGSTREPGGRTPPAHLSIVNSPNGVGKGARNADDPLVLPSRRPRSRIARLPAGSLPPRVPTVPRPSDIASERRFRSSCAFARNRIGASRGGRAW